MTSCAGGKRHSHKEAKAGKKGGKLPADESAPLAAPASRQGAGTSSASTTITAGPGLLKSESNKLENSDEGKENKEKEKEKDVDGKVVTVAVTEKKKEDEEGLPIMGPDGKPRVVVTKSSTSKTQTNGGTLVVESMTTTTSSSSSKIESSDEAPKSTTAATATTSTSTAGATFNNPSNAAFAKDLQAMRPIAQSDNAKECGSKPSEPEVVEALIVAVPKVKACVRLSEERVRKDSKDSGARGSNVERLIQLIEQLPPEIESNEVDDADGLDALIIEQKPTGSKFNRASAARPAEQPEVVEELIMPQIHPRTGLVDGPSPPGGSGAESGNDERLIHIINQLSSEGHSIKSNSNEAAVSGNEDALAHELQLMEQLAAQGAEHSQSTAFLAPVATPVGQSIQKEKEKQAMPIPGDTPDNPARPRVDLKLKLKLKPDEPRTSYPADAEDEEEDSSEAEQRESAEEGDESEQEIGGEEAEAMDTVAELGVEHPENVLAEFVSHVVNIPEPDSHAGPTLGSVLSPTEKQIDEGVRVNTGEGEHEHKSQSGLALPELEARERVSVPPPQEPHTPPPDEQEDPVDKEEQSTKIPAIVVEQPEQQDEEEQEMDDTRRSEYDNMDTENSEVDTEPEEQAEVNPDNNKKEEEQAAEAEGEELDEESRKQNELFDQIRKQLENQREEDRELQEFEAQERAVAQGEQGDDEGPIEGEAVLQDDSNLGPLAEAPDENDEEQETQEERKEKEKAKEREAEVKPAKHEAEKQESTLMEKTLGVLVAVVEAAGNAIAPSEYTPPPDSSPNLLELGALLREYEINVSLNFC